MPAATSYADWKAPQADGGTLLWPDGPALVEAAKRNHDALAAAAAPVQGVPLNRLRANARRYLGLGDDELAILTGHQSELYHPGVWAKNLVLHHAAEQAGGRAMHVVVDTDTPKHLNLRWPSPAVGQVGGDEPWTDDPALASAGWTGRLRTATPGHVEHLRAKLAEADIDAPLMTPVLDKLMAANVEQTLALAPDGASLPAALTAATHELDWSLGLKHDALTLSPVLFSPPFLTLVHHIAANLPAFAADYNAALTAYRRCEGIDDPQRPMPDLEPGELPLWLDDEATGRRRRARLTGDTLTINGEPFTFDPAADADDAARSLMMFLRRHRHRLSPRALTLKLFLRLLVADTFVHGIGGGRYDQVTDDLIRRHFGLTPPSFAVATATLFAPGVTTLDRLCPPCIKADVHHLAHDFPGKPEHLAKLATLTGRRRATAFAAMHAARHAHNASDPRLQRTLSTLDALPQRSRWEKTWFDRELFYALQPRHRLTGLLDRFAW